MGSSKTKHTWWCTIVLSVYYLSYATADKYRLCLVDGKGRFKKSLHYCPALDKPDSKVECVLALDRLDCLRRLNKGTVDFTILSPEDLVTAENAGVEVLVTNELRYTNDTQDYEVVAVIDNKSGIKNRNDLRGRRYCHPGYGYEADWNRILSNYFEASVVVPSCDPKLSVTENRILATSKFFSSACKAGPWVNNQTLERELKSKYSSLCELCGDPYKCSKSDKYWGRRGSLLCLTDGAGEVSWARWDDVQLHFGLMPGQTGLSPEGYSLLCPDDTVAELNTTKPCVWVVRPWAVIASGRTKAQEIQGLISTLSYEDRMSWRANLLRLLQDSYTIFQKVEPVEPIESYLDRATGFLSANSFSGCHPPRTIRICTTSIIENAKCSWLRESAAVYGVEPDLECLKADNTTHCMQAVRRNAADIVMVPPDSVHHAIRQYDLRTLFHETVNDDNKYLTVAVTLPTKTINTFEDLRGKKACFPAYDGVSWNTVKNYLFKNNIIKMCSLDQEMANFFGQSCTPGLPNALPHSLREKCQGTTFEGDFGALHCLTSGVGDVAFVSYNSILKYISDAHEENPGKSLTLNDFKILFCENDSKDCHLSWASAGQGMIRSNSSDLWVSDTLDVFLQLSELFGKDYQSLTNPFNLFGKYDGKSNVLFQDATLRLRPVPYTKNTDVMENPYENFLNVDQMCIESSSSYNNFNIYVVLFSLLISLFKLL